MRRNSTSESERTEVEVEVTVDSGACDTVMLEEDCKHINAVSSRKSQAGFHCEVANGMEIPNQGETECMAMTEDSDIPKRIDFQVASVHKTVARRREMRGHGV